ncbi:ATP-binding cassette domain-containing protein [Actinomadura coerulea]|uniref:ATP-binding cassette domain-containing protein n=1 Tax=Actinomadura coerulea TaxID=46159 RepID=UPI00342E69CA
MDDPPPVTAAEWTEPPQAGRRRLPGTVLDAVRLAVAAAPREFALVTVLQAAGGLGLVLPVLGGRRLLDRALGGAGLTAVLAQGAVVLAMTALVAVAVSVASSRDEVLSEQLNRYAMGRILDVACAVDLEEFERPAFHNRLERASMSARIRPHQVVQGLGALTGALMATAGVALALAAIEPLLVPTTVAAGAPLWLAGLKSGQVLYGALFRLTPAERERSYLLDVLTSRRAAAEVRAFGLAPHLRARWEARTRERLGEIRRTVRRRLRITLLARAVSGLALAAVLGPVLARAATGAMPAADAGAAATAVLLLASRLRAAAAGTDQFFEAAPFVRDLRSFLGRPERAGDRRAVERVARAAGADPFLRGLPDGYGTLLGPEFAGGVDLSGGQWQRVALARAFFRDAPFVILDEPTATLDARAEHDLFERLRDLLAGRTVLLISHRFSTVRTADHIYVLDGGRIAEHGTHASLMAAGGRYAELFALQAEGYLDPAAIPGR